jgi:hypothetical protein
VADTLVFNMPVKDRLPLTFSPQRTHAQCEVDSNCEVSQQL